MQPCRAIRVIGGLFNSTLPPRAGIHSPEPPAEGLNTQLHQTQGIVGAQGYVGSTAVYLAEDEVGWSLQGLPTRRMAGASGWTEECPHPFSHSVFDLPIQTSPMETSNRAQGPLRDEESVPYSPNGPLLVLPLPSELQELVSFLSHLTNPESEKKKKSLSLSATCSLVFSLLNHTSPIHGFWHLHHPGNLLVWLCLFSVPHMWLVCIQRT